VKAKNFELINSENSVMKNVCINYVTNCDSAEENRQLIVNLFKELHEKNTKGVKYAAFKMGENLFVHLAHFKDKAAQARFRRLPAFRAFQENIQDRLSSQPITIRIREIGSFSSSSNDAT
jgi:hypothetical protein